MKIKISLDFHITSMPLKREEKKCKVLLYNDRAQLISETCGVSRRQSFNTKRAFSSPKLRKKTDLLWQSWAKILVSFDLRFFHRTSPQPPTLDMMFVTVCKRLNFPVLSKSTYASIQVLSCEFCKIFKNSYLTEHCEKMLVMIWSLLDSFVRLLFIKMENKRISKIIAS